jgi:hypothetical protein
VLAKVHLAAGQAPEPGKRRFLALDEQDAAYAAYRCQRNRHGILRGFRVQGVYDSRIAANGQIRQREL